MVPGSLEKEHDAAERAAIAAAEQLRDLQRTLGSDRDVDASAVMKEAEYAAEEAITDVIADVFDGSSPDHGLLFEEDRERESDGKYTWLVDPLDGTDSFRDGGEDYAVSIAVYEETVPKVGVVVEPEPGRLFAAVDGDSPVCKELVTDDEGGLVAGDGEELEPEWDDSVSEATIVSGYDRGGQFLRSLEDKFEGVDVDRCSSAALNLCKLARGKAAGHWEFDTYPWDVAGGLVVAKAADATVTNPETDSPDRQDGGFQPGLEPTNEPLPLLASNEDIHESLRETAREVLPEGRTSGSQPT